MGGKADFRTSRTEKKIEIGISLVELVAIIIRHYPTSNQKNLLVNPHQSKPND